MRNSYCQLGIILIFGIGLISPSVEAASPIQIRQVVVDTGPRTITITGGDFSFKNIADFRVTLGDGVVVNEDITATCLITLPTPDRIVCAFGSSGLTLPPAGDYLLTVQTDKGVGQYDLTIGAVGPRGPQGLPGDQGSQGEQGIPGVSGWELITTATGNQTVPSGGDQRLSAFCPSGKRVIGGGCSLSNGYMTFFTNVPLTTYWRCAAWNRTSGSVSNEMKTWAICANVQ